MHKDLRKSRSGPHSQKYSQHGMVVRDLVQGGHLPGKNDFKTIGDMKLNEIEIIRHKLQDG